MYIYICTHIFVCICDSMYVYKCICTHICMDSFLEILLTFPSTDNSQHSNYWPGNNNKIQKRRQENPIFLLGHTSGNILLVLSCGSAAVVQLVKCEQKRCGSGPETPGMHLPSLCHQPAACQEYIVQPESMWLPESLF